ncbi:prepilin peptidase CpaA [Ochrobactrum sp. BH3]|nr:prepilin peptidase CpaA [Ochrobactrum sp. BH3]
MIYIMFVGLVAAAALSDLWSMRISNINVTLLATFYLFLALMTQSQAVVLSSVCLASFALVLCFVLFSASLIGGGDAKLFSVLLLWFGVNELVLTYLVLVGLIGGLITIIAITARRISWPDKLIGFMPVWLTQRRAGIPYGVALGLAAIWLAPEIAILKSV